MNGELSQAEIARALGLAKSRITALKKQGMPVHSVEAAQEWRRRHVAPIARVKQQAKPYPAIHSQHQQAIVAAPNMPARIQPRFRYPHGYGALDDLPEPLQPFLQMSFDADLALKRAAALGSIAEVALKNGTFDNIEPFLRFALSAVPRTHRGKFEGMPMAVWTALTNDVLKLFNVDHVGLNQTPKLTGQDDALFIGEFWYQVAAGEIKPAVTR